MQVRRNYLHWLWRPPALLFWIILMSLIFALARALKFEWHRELPHQFHRGCQIILGLRVSVSGETTSLRPTLFVSNHISYLDIFVLGEIRAWYIAKSEVASWPVLGSMARFQNTLFVERKSGRARQQLEIMREHLQSGQNLILFAEGTSTDGAHVEPFKSSLFEAANCAKRVVIQPITLAYTRQADQPMNQAMRDNYAWYNNMPLMPHFLNLLNLKSVDVKVHFHPVTYLDQFSDRKQCADYCRHLVEQQLLTFIQTDN